MVVEDIHGCRDSVQWQTIKNLKVNMDIKVKNQGPYCMGDSVTFEWKNHPDVNRFIWIFGDPKSGRTNVNIKDPSPTHVFDTEPGAYPITLTVSTPMCPTKDTTICCIHINGPQAVIDYPSPAFGINRGNRPMEVDKTWLAKLNNEPNFSTHTTEVYYYVLKDTLPYAVSFKTSVSDTLFFSDGRKEATPYINAFVKSSIGDTTVYVNDTFDYVVVGKLRKWKRGQTIPEVTMYQDLGNLLAGPVARRMIPQNQIHANPDVDSLVIDFPNFSIKYRYNEAFGQTHGPIPRYPDDLAALGAATYTGYPYASDSLESFWDFDDPAAPNCISTAASPNPYCRYSREKTPRHIFTQNGCFNVSLEMTDQQIGCSHTTHLPISFENPLAGFDTIRNKRVDWLAQNELLRQGKPLEGLGLRLDGAGCPMTESNPNFMALYLDGTEPNCGTRQNYWFVGDAESDCRTKVYVKDGSGNIVDSTYKDCSWIDGTTLKLIGEQWTYEKPGWKNPGLIIQSGPIQFDTFFYHNYIYIPQTFAPTVLVSNTRLDSQRQRSHYTLGVENQINQNLDSITSLDFSLLKIGSTKTKLKNMVLRKDFFSVNSNGLVDLNDTMKFDLSPGQYLVRTETETGRGCRGEGDKYLQIGHVAGIKVKTACAGAPVQFHDSVYYYHPEGPEYCDKTGWYENLGNCIDTSQYFYRGAAIRQAVKAKNSNYKLPAFTERIAWDFDNDGVIDLWDQHHPSHVYKTGGEHTCAMWTQDSIGQWQKDSLTFAVHDIKLSLSRGSQWKYICPPSSPYFILKAKIRGADSAIVSYNGYDTKITNGDSMRSWLSITNKESYKLAFKVVSATGCLDSLTDSTLFVVMGAFAKYEITSDSVGCAPYQLKVKNLSDTGHYRWELHGHDTIFTKDLDETLNLGAWYLPWLYVTQRLIHPQSGLPITCTSRYPVWSFRKNRVQVSQIENGLLEQQPLENLRVRYTISNIRYFHNYEFKVYQNNQLIGSRIVDDTTFVYTYPSAGDYSICLTTTSGACIDSLCESVNVDYLSIPETGDPSTRIYPNPAQHQITVLAENSATHFELHSVVGQLVKTGALSSEQTVIDLDNLSEGVYVLVLTGDGLRESHRIVLER